MDGILSLAIRFAIDYPVAAARRLETVAPEGAVFLLSQLTPEQGAGVLSRMAPAQAAEVLARSDRDQWTSLLSLLPTRASVAVLRHMDEEIRTRVLESLPAGVAGRLSRLLRFPEGAVGAVMDSSIAPVPLDMNVDDVRRRESDHRIPYLYLVDREQRLAGVVHRRDLSAGAGGAAVSSLSTTEVIRIPARVPVATIRGHESWREFEALPVVDGAGVYVGVLRHKDIRGGVETPEPPGSARPPLATLLDLGEVYWNGLSSLIEALGTGATDDLQQGEYDER